MQELGETVNLKRLGDAQLVMRNERVAIYKRSETIYEVFKRKFRNERTARFGERVVTYPAGEVYPSDEDFGVWAWCYVRLEDAEKKYNKL